jgi:hypothetical protein
VDALQQELATVSQQQALGQLLAVELVLVWVQQFAQELAQ